MLPDSPDKADELARNGGTDLVLELAACHQVPKALTQPLLRRPCDLLDLRRCTLCAPLPFLSRHGHRYTGRSRWTQAHWRWLEGIKFVRPEQQIVLQE